MRECDSGPRKLGIDLASGSEEEYFKWLLACLLFGKPIQQKVAANTFRLFVDEGITSLQAVREAGWDYLVTVLDSGHYVRYDFSTATKLLEVCAAVEERYGSVSRLCDGASYGEIASRLDEFKGIGPVTARIFVNGLSNAMDTAPT